MKEKIISAFDAVTADEALKEKTKEYLAAKRRSAPKRRPLLSWKNAAAFAACLLMLTVGATGVKAYYTETAYLSIDVNPSIELGINGFGIVISQTAYNEDARAVLESVNVRNKRYTKAVELLLNSGALNAYLSEDAVIDFSVVSDDAVDVIAELDTYIGAAPYAVMYTQCSMQTRSEAHGFGMSFGKYALYQALCEYDGSITVEECREMSVGEIMRTLNAHRNGNGAQNGGGGQNQNTGGERNENGNQNGNQDKQNGNQGGNGNNNNNGNNGNNGHKQK